MKKCKAFEFSRKSIKSISLKRDQKIQKLGANKKTISLAQRFLFRIQPKIKKGVVK